MHPVTSPENYGTSSQGVNYGGWRAKSYGNGRSFSDMGIDSGTTYTFSWLQWSDQVGSYPQMGFYGQLEGGSTNGFHDGRSPSHQGQLVAGVWERKSWTISSAADWKQANIPSIYCYGYIGATTAASTIRVTDIQVEVKGYSTPYIDKVPLTNTYEAHRLAANGWRDISGNGNHGTLTNMVGTGTAHYKEGNIIRLGGPVTNGFNISNDPMYLDFAGDDDYVTISSVLTVATVEVWFNADAISGDQVLYGPHANGADNWLAINGSGQIYFYGTESADTNNFSMAGGSVSAGNWHQAVTTISGSTATIYLNGDQVNSVTKAFTIGSWAGNADVGRRGSAGGRYFNGKIAMVRVYSQALSHANIRQIYNSQKNRFGL